MGNAHRIARAIAIKKKKTTHESLIRNHTSKEEFMFVWRISTNRSGITEVINNHTQKQKQKQKERKKKKKKKKKKKN